MIKRKVIILGSTGSIGTTCLNAIRNGSLYGEVTGLVARSSKDTLIALAKEFNCSPALIAFLDAKGMIKCEHKTHTNAKFYDKEAYDKLKEWLEEDEEEV